MGTMPDSGMVGMRAPTMHDTYSAVIPIRAKPKPRPRGGKGHFYLPKDFQEWRTEMVKALHDANFPHFEGPVGLYATFYSDATSIQLVDLSDHQRAKHVRADLDNLLGGLFEVLQDSGVIDNDNQIVQARAAIARR